MGVLAKNIQPQTTTNYLDSTLVRNTSGFQILKGDMLRVTGVGSTSDHLQVKPALAGESGPLLNAAHNIDDGDVGVARKDAVLPLDTSSASVGDKVFLSDTSIGALTLVDSGEQVGWVGSVGTSGLAIVIPDAQAPTVTPSTTKGWDGARIWLEHSFTQDMTTNGATNTLPGFDSVFKRMGLYGDAKVVATASAGPVKMLCRLSLSTAAYVVATSHAGVGTLFGFNRGQWVGQNSWLTTKNISLKFSLSMPTSTTLAGARYAAGLSQGTASSGIRTDDAGGGVGPYADNMFVRYDSSLSPNWVLVTRNAGVATLTDTGVVVTSGVRYTFEFDVNASQEVTLRVNGAVVVSGATNVLNSTPTYLGSPAFTIQGVSGTADHGMNLYKVAIGCDI